MFAFVSILQHRYTELNKALNVRKLYKFDEKHCNKSDFLPDD